MQQMKRTLLMALALVLSLACAAGAAFGPPRTFSTEAELGGALYFDRDLSVNRNQACASCHLPATGFDDPNRNLPVSEGSVPGLFGTRNAPSSAYAAFAPAYDPDTVQGGQFWDGRADSLALQAEGPPTNPVEMAMLDKAAVLARLTENQAYVAAFKLLYRIDLPALDPSIQNDVDFAYGKMAQAIGEFERTRMFNKFNSRFDSFLASGQGLSAKELRGWDLFNGKAKCANCHLSAITTNSDNQQVPPLFTDFTYDNLGIPVNPQIASLRSAAGLITDIDYGLGGRTQVDNQKGKFKVMTLRNIAVTAPYGHNGFFKSLKEIVHFYNTRAVLPTCEETASPRVGVNCWPAPEVPLNVNSTELGNLELTPAEESDLVAFLCTLTDGIGPSPFGDVPVPSMP